MKKRKLEELLAGREQEPYAEQYRYILCLIKEGRIRPVRSSPGNGKRPALRTLYWMAEDRPDYSDWEEELLYRTDARIHVDYYLSHPEAYGRDRYYVRRLHDYLQTMEELPLVPVSRNERSFAIWGEEKFLAGGGRTILNRCGMEESLLGVYATAEPFAYFAAHRDTPQNLLILENKDPFYGMRKFLLDGKTQIFGTEIGTLLYGAGKRVISSFRDFGVSAEPYMKEQGNRFLYFGDLDYEGIGIYESLEETFAPHGRIRPFVPAYLAMLDKGDRAPSLPQTKEQQNRNSSGRFFSFFDKETIRRMNAVLGTGRYIPQEILHIGDY